MRKISLKVVKFLNKKRLKISLAESCTGGLLSSTITSISGSSKVFTVGLVYIRVKKGNKTLVKKFLFKTKKRNSIQRSTVTKALNLVLSLVK